MTQNRGGQVNRRPLTPAQRRKILEMRRKRRLKKRLMIAVPIAVVLVILLVVLLTSGNRGSDSTQTPHLTIAPSSEPAMANGDLASVAPSATPEPTVAPNVYVPTGSFNFDEAYVAAARGMETGPLFTADYSKVDPAKLSYWPETKDGYLPILYKANTTENIIAITVDDCFQGENLQQIVQCAVNNGGKLTIFPIGKNLEKSSVATGIRYAYESGMEIGNHTYNHAGMYHNGDDHMTSELWYQIQKVNEVLGVNYTQHFFRPKGGDEREDQRVHAYVHQLGYNGVAMWSQSGSTDSLDSLYNNLAPGKIYLFHTTDNDLNKLLQFIPGVVARGYRLVTLSEMFGLPENEVSELTPPGEKPELQSFKVLPATLKKTTYIRAAAVVQQRLIELGWLEGEADGVYGQSSFMATGFFQMAAGIQPTGNADVALFADDAPRGSKERIEELKQQLGK